MMNAVGGKDPPAGKSKSANLSNTEKEMLKEIVSRLQEEEKKSIKFNLGSANIVKFRC
jgi:hypothetical protein